MIGVQVAQQLREAGLTWKPAPGDRFTIPDRDMDDQIFYLADMTIEVYQMPNGRVIGFNGTTEWALDDVELDETLWLPREDQLRDALAGTFVNLTRELTDERASYIVTTRVDGAEARSISEDPAEAYGLALLALLRSLT